MTDSAVPVLETARLVLTIPSAEAAGAAAEYVLRNKQHHAPWGPVYDGEYFTQAFWVKELESRRERFAGGSCVELLFFDKTDDRREHVLGEVNLMNIMRGVSQSCYLGYKLDLHAVGKGFMYEAIRSALGYAFADLQLHRVMARHMPTNIRSRNILRRLGFQVEGYARDCLFIAGVWEDHVLTAIRSDQFS